MFEGLEVLDTVRLNFSEHSLKLLNFTLAFIMFGVALDLRLSRFKEVFLNPKPTILGIASQFLVMPLFTFLLVLLINPTPGVALGMLLVAACPGGNISNFMTAHAKGNTELSVTLTAISDISSVILTPLNFAFWGGMYAHFYTQASHLVIPVKIDFWEMFQTMILLLGLPLVLGMIFARRYPRLTIRIKRPIKLISLLIFAAYVFIAIGNNFSYIVEYVGLIFLIVFLHNLVALSTGFSVAKIFKLSGQDTRTITIETGIQNSGLALVLIFNPKLFNGIGGMAFIAALWGIWHIVSGLGISSLWALIPVDLNRKRRRR